MNTRNRSTRRVLAATVAAVAATALAFAPGVAGAVATGAVAAAPRCSDSDIYVSDAVAFGADNGGLIKVDGATGVRATLSENNNPTGGPDFDTPAAIAIDADGTFVVAETDETGVRNPSVIRVDPKTGVRTLISDNTTPAGGPDFSEPQGIAIEADGSILVSDLSAFPAGNGGVIRVDPATGARTSLSHNGAPAGGPKVETPWDIAVAPGGDIYVIDNGDKLVRVDPVTGARTLVSKNTSPTGGPDFVWPWGLTFAPNGDVLVSDKQAFGGSGGIIRVDPVTGTRSTVSQNAAPVGGPSFQSPGDIFFYCGSILVTDQFADSVMRIDLATGARTLVSDNANPAGSPQFGYPWGIVALPRPLGPTTSPSPSHSTPPHD
jgi:sugar lactone lactonase YvrE